MTRLLQNDLEAEAITLEAEARRIREELGKAQMSDQQREVAIRLYAQARDDAAAKLREAMRALQSLTPIGIAAPR